MHNLYGFLQVEDLVSNDKLNVVSEEQVFVAVVDWIKHNHSERSQYIAKVTSPIHFPSTLRPIFSACLYQCICFMMLLIILLA